MTQETPRASRLPEAVAFFQQAVWERLMAALYAKYIEQGQVRGQVILRACTFDEQRAIARFLGKSLALSSDLTVRLADFQVALVKSFACDFPGLLRALFPAHTHITRPQQRAQQALFQQTFAAKLDALVEDLPDDAPGRAWLTHGKHGREALFRQYKNSSLAIQEQTLQTLHTVVQALTQLPVPSAFQSISHFALRISGDPHFFDLNTAGGRLFLTALTDLRLLEDDGTGTVLNERPDDEAHAGEQDHWRHLLYYEAGILLDTISSTVAAFQLKEAQDESGQSDAFVTSAGARILILPLRQLLIWKKLWPFSRHVYVFENPQVFEVVVDSLLQRSTATQSEHLPTLVCTAGWPSIAALRLLSLLIDASPEVQLHYSGDFDLQGLRIASHLLARYPHNCRLWRFDSAAYLTALHRRGAAFGVNELAGLQNLPAIFSTLTVSMQREQRKAYHEGITDILLEDIYTANG